MDIWPRKIECRIIRPFFQKCCRKIIDCSSLYRERIRVYILYVVTTQSVSEAVTADLIKLSKWYFIDLESVGLA